MSARNEKGKNILYLFLLLTVFTTACKKASTDEDIAANIDFGSAGTWIDAVNAGINLGTGIYSQTLAPGEYHIFSKMALK
ncbi:hypothetical protein [Pedobacter alluvionis]|uniref:Uncharacterized protein n=1 Tax=Pedobacter alluvionis TaxID=475253 RepID=A0A497XXK5_9SPHI|nr:hypothetical protein [Pedobacter alluvionis]RLJ72042.1 hypothetical protein BCL90_4871 [Pedobacter alluvionis]TFB28814.1 hypothetical protein E3V97_22095 [Pedobacter alluvionis]